MTREMARMRTPELLDLPMAEVRRIVANALEEDLGAGDITTDNLVPAETRATAHFSYRVPGVVCGLDVIVEVFRQIDPRLEVEQVAQEGDHVEAGAVAAILRGSARSILKGERVA